MRIEKLRENFSGGRVGELCTPDPASSTSALAPYLRLSLRGLTGMIQKSWCPQDAMSPGIIKPVVHILSGKTKE